MPTMPNASGVIEGIDGAAVIQNIVLTIVLWSAAFGVRWLILRFLRARNLSAEEIRKFIASTRSIALLTLVVGTAALWFDELKIFALSLAAVSAAGVLATKELIMCVGGTFLRTSSRSFEIGDRIEINGVRGDVIDASLLSTTILEIGPGHVGHQRTGRAIVLPSSLFLSHAVINESFTDAYVLHTFHVLAPHDGTWAQRERALLDAAAAEMSAYADEARTFFERMSLQRGIDTPTQEPRVLLQLDDPSGVRLICRLPTPARRKGRIEQAVLRRYLASVSALQAPAPAQTAAPTSSSVVHAAAR